jgi:hypothetical protein
VNVCLISPNTYRRRPKLSNSFLSFLFSPTANLQLSIILLIILTSVVHSFTEPALNTHSLFSTLRYPFLPINPSKLNLSRCNSQSPPLPSWPLPSWPNPPCTLPRKSPSLPADQQSPTAQQPALLLARPPVSFSGICSFWSWTNIHFQTQLFTLLPQSSLPAQSTTPTPPPQLFLTQCQPPSLPVVTLVLPSQF